MSSASSQAAEGGGAPAGAVPAQEGGLSPASAVAHSLSALKDSRPVPTVSAFNSTLTFMKTKSAFPTVDIEVPPGSPEVEHLGPITLTLPEHLVGYNLKPVHYGRVIALNATDRAMYELQPENPTMVVWVLSGADPKKSLGYCKRRLWEAAYARGVTLETKMYSRFELLASKDGIADLHYCGEKVDPPDLVVSRVGASVTHFGLAVIRQIEKMGITVINDVASVDMSRDKQFTMQEMSAHGLPIPKTLLLNVPVNLKVVEDNFDFPLVLKKASGSQGKGVMIVKEASVLDDMADLLDKNEPLIIQEFIKASSGRDLRVLVVGGRCVASMMRIAQKGFKANVHQGGSVRPVTLSPNVEWLCLEAARITGLDIAGIDLLIDTHTYKICEINSSPGFEGLERATCFDVAATMVSYFKLRQGMWRVPRRRTAPKPAVLDVPVEDDHRNAS